MNPLARLLVVVVCCAAVACGKADPDARSADWEEQFDLAMKASKAGQHDQALAIAEAYLEKHPGSTDGHMMVGDAAHEAGKAAGGVNRVARLEQAASHYARVIETSANPTMRGIALSDAIEVYGVRGLKKFDEAERLARVIVTEKSGNVHRYNTLVQVQTEAQKYDAVATTLGEARKAAGTDTAAVVAYASLVYEVAMASAMPAESLRPVLADALTTITRALATDGSNVKLLEYKGVLLRHSSQIEPDAARKTAIDEEWLRTMEKLKGLEK